MKIAEIRYGIERLPTADRSRRRLEEWLTGELQPWFSDRLLDVDEDVFVVWRRLVEKGKAMRDTFPQPNLFIRRNRDPARPLRRDPQHRRFPSNRSASLEPVDGY